MSDALFSVHLVDDDTQILKALSRVLAGAGYEVRTFIDAETFLDQHDPSLPGCVVVDLGLPGKDGFVVQAELGACGRPVIFLTGRGDVPASVRAMKGGALDFLQKPVDIAELLAAIDQARRVDDARRKEFLERQDFDARIARLTPRELQVLDHVVIGRLNKQIAASLGIVEKTIKVHRGRMMKKLGVRTVADLVRTVKQFQG